MEKTPEQTAKANPPGSDRARFSVPTLSVPTLSRGRISTSQPDPAPKPTSSVEAAPEPEPTETEHLATELETQTEVDPAAEPEEKVEPKVEAAPQQDQKPRAKSTSQRMGLAVALPKVTLPKVTLPKIALPKVALPKVELPKLSLPKVKLPGARGATSSAAKSSTPKPTTQSKVVAPIEVAKKRTRGKPTTVLLVKGLTKRFDETIAVDGVDLEVMSGAFYGIVGPNGAGKTTTLSMITGLLRPDAGTVSVNGADVWTDPVVAKRNMGVLPDRLRLFDRLTGAQLLFYAGALRGMDSRTVRHRSADLANAFGLEDALGRLVSDYSAGMTKKIALAAAMIHSPRLLVLDEPFESVDPVSAATVTDILKKYASEGGTVLLSSHSMDLVQRICDNVAVVVGGSILADGTMAAVRNGHTLEERFVELAGGRKTVEGLEWLHSFSD